MSRLLDISFEDLIGQREIDFAPGCSVGFTTPSRQLDGPLAAKLKVVGNEASGQNYARIRYNSQTTRETNYVRALLYIETDGLTDGKYINILNLERAVYTHCAEVWVLKSGTQLELVFRYYNDGAYQFSGAHNITIGTVYEVEYKYDRTSQAWEFRVDGNTIDSGSLTGSLGAGPTRLQAGIGDDYDVAATSIIWLDAVGWATDTWVESASSKIIDDSFEEPSFTSIIDANCTLDPDATLPGTPPANSGSRCLKSVVADATNNDSFLYWVTTDQNVAYVMGCIYISEAGFGIGQVFQTLELLNIVNFPVAGIQITKVAGVGKARFQYYSGGSLLSTGFVNLDIDTWYCVEYKYDIPSMQWEWRIGGVTQHSGSLSAATRTPQKFLVGIEGHTGTSQTTMYTDLVALDDSEWPSQKVIIRPGTLEVSASVPAYALPIPTKITPEVLSVAASIPAYTVGIKVVVQPEVLSVAASIPAYTARGGIKITPDALSLAMSVPQYTILAGSTLILATLGLTISIPPYDVFALKSVETMRERPRAEPVYLLDVELKNSGPTLHVSDRNISVFGQRYEAYLDDITGLGQECRRTGALGLNADLTVPFRNLPWRTYNYLVEAGEDYPFEGAAVTVKECYLDVDGEASEVVTIFKGFLDEPRDIDLMSFKCKASSVEFHKDRTWKQAVINTDDWPNAYEDVGEVEPIVYGSDIRVPALRVDWGSRTTLQAEITESSSSLELSDGERFPSSSFDVWIDNEKIHIATRTDNSCTGLTRGYGGTTATAHRAGADVAEAKAQYDSLLACHELSSVGDIFAEITGKLWRVTSGVSAVAENGKHLLRATENITVEAVKDDIGINDGITVGDDIAMTVPDNQKTIYPNGHQCSTMYNGICSMPEWAHDDNEATYCEIRKDTIGGMGYASIEILFPSTNYGNIVKQTVWAKVAGNPVTASGWSPSSIIVPSAAWVKFEKSGGTWGDSIRFGHGSAFNAFIYEVKKEVTYAAATNKSGSAYRSGAVIKSGDVVGTDIVERFHADVSGYKDPDGNYGGSGNLVERPDWAIKYFLVQVLGEALADINIASFAAAGASYASAITGGYKLAFRVDRKIKPSEFLALMAKECRSTLVYRAGKWYLDFIPDSAPSAVKTITKGELAGEFVKFRFARTPITELANDLTARFMRNYSRLGSDSEWDGTSMQSDATSKTKYGTYPKEFDFELIRDQDMADNVLAHMLLERKAPRLRVEFPVYWEHFGLQVGHTVEIDNPLYNGRKFYIEDIRREGKKIARVKALQWW